MAGLARFCFNRFIPQDFFHSAGNQVANGNVFPIGCFSKPGMNLVRNVEPKFYLFILS